MPQFLNNMEIKRDKYLNELVAMKHSRFVKTITGIRRCGKSYLLMKLFARHLKDCGVDGNHIIAADMDDYKNKPLHDPQNLYEYLESKLCDDGMHYILLDEIQLTNDFAYVLNGFLKKDNADIYVTGSNAKLLSTDVITEFRGRGHEIRIHPLTFKEFMSAYSGTVQKGLDEYMTYGGLPQIFEFGDEPQKANFLKNLFAETYIRDIRDRYDIRKDDELEELLDLIASNIGGLTNPTKIANTFKSVKKSDISHYTIKKYLDYFQDSFLIEKASRYDIKGRSYIDSPCKYYFSDMGLRNARLNFRQNEKSHLMENVVYNELVYRGFNVDVGVVPVRTAAADGATRRTQLEIDFVCNMGSKRYYVQSAFAMPTQEKREQEEAPLKHADGFFKRVIVTGDDIVLHRDDTGITTMSIYDFLLNENSLDF